MIYTNSLFRASTIACPFQRMLDVSNRSAIIIGTWKNDTMLPLFYGIHHYFFHFKIYDLLLSLNDLISKLTIFVSASKVLQATELLARSSRK